MHRAHGGEGESRTKQESDSSTLQAKIDEFATKGKQMTSEGHSAVSILLSFGDQPKGKRAGRLTRLMVRELPTGENERAAVYEKKMLINIDRSAGPE